MNYRNRMKQSDKVSVCIPAYNAATYIPSTLDSIVAQSYENIEIIVSDNASTDNTRHIVESFAKRDKRIRYFRNQENIGYVRNIERAVKASACDIVAVFHADDFYERTIIEKELTVLKNRSDISAVFTKYRCFYGEHPQQEAEIRERWESRLPYDSSVDAYYGDIARYIPIFLRIGNPFCCPSLMTRKEDYFSLGGFSDKYPSNEDLELWIKYLLESKTLAIIPKTLVNYRRSRGQGSSYWESRLDLPVFYRVVDEMIMPYVDKKLSARTVYIQRKATTLIDLAARISVHDQRHKALLRDSGKVFHFPIYTERGLLQRFPYGLDRLKEVYHNAKQSTRQRFPNSYRHLKMIYKLLVRSSGCI